MVLCHLHGRAVAALLALVAAPLGAADLTPIAYTGQPAPGLPGFVFEGVWDEMRLSDSGDLVFREFATDGLPKVALFHGRPGALSLLAADGLPAPGTEAGTNYLDPLINLAMDGSGRVLFSSLLAGPSVLPETEQYIGFGTPPSPALIARTGFPAAELPALVQYSQFPGFMGVSGDGYIGFSGFVTTLGEPFEEDGAVWVRDPSGVFSVAARREGFVPGGDARYLTPVFADIAAGGLTLFTSQLDSTFTLVYNGFAYEASGVFVRRPDGSVVTVARSGEQAAGMPAGITYTFLQDTAVISDTGVVAFTARIQGATADDGRVLFNTNDGGLFAGPIGAVTLVARRDDPAPGMPAGVLIDRVDRPQVARTGVLVFTAALKGQDITVANAQVLYIGQPGSIAPVLQRGAQAPGLPDGVVIANIGNPGINGRGEVVFQAFLQGPGVVPEFNDHAVYAMDQNGQLHLLVREADTVQVAPGDVRTVLGIELSSELPWSGTGGRQFFNLRGEALMLLYFTDETSGIFLGRVPSCRADFDGSGGDPAVADIFAFLSAWFANDPRADFDGSGGAPQVADIFAFLSAWFAGC